MTRRKTLPVALLFCCALVCVVIWSVTKTPVQGQPQRAARGKGSNPLAALNAKVRTAKSGGEGAARALADEIFANFNFDQAPAGMTDALKDRLVRAEVNYRNGGKGVIETDIVRTVNRLAHVLKAPDFARTNLYEVRRLQVGIAPYMPELRPQQSDADEASAGRGRGAHRAPVSRTLSPLEATYIAALLVQQKQSNPEFQLTNEEWIALHGGARVSKGGDKFNAEMAARMDNRSRSDELQRAIKRSFSAMTPAQMLNLPVGLLDALGVDR
ncbi:MAG TPA: hypothetical protein VEX60_14700 [Pyrinomonadaceae bacterium]|nr:hypothetical protein [Pyrinomonadaceae bacterium]